jgi:hypothetical protein
MTTKLAEGRGVGTAAEGAEQVDIVKWCFRGCELVMKVWRNLRINLKEGSLNGGRMKSMDMTTQVYNATCMW